MRGSARPQPPCPGRSDRRPYFPLPPMRRSPADQTRFPRRHHSGGDMQVLSRFVNGQPTVGPMLRHVGGWAVVVMMVLSCLPCSAHAAPQGSAANPATQASASPDVAKKDGSDNKPHNTGIVVG